jgi:hypothetical protein
MITINYEKWLKCKLMIELHKLQRYNNMKPSMVKISPWGVKKDEKKGEGVYLYWNIKVNS